MTTPSKPPRKPWHLLTEAADTVQDPEDRRRARLLKALLLVLLPATAAVVALAWLGAEEADRLLFLAGGAVIVVLLGLAWRLSGTRHYPAAAAIALSAITAVAILHTVVRAASEPALVPATVVWTLLPILLANMLLSVRGTSILAAIVLAGVACLPLWVPAVGWASLGEPLGLVLAVSALVMVAAAIRREDAERIEAQTRALAASGQRFRALYDGVAVAIIAHDKGVIRDANAAVTRLLGYTPADVEGERLETLFAEGFHGEIGALALARDAEPLEAIGRRHDGSPVNLQVIANQAMLPGEALQVVELRDVTELREAQEAMRRAKRAAEEANEAQAGFLSYVTRALRPPLVAAQRIAATLLGNRAKNLRPEDLVFLRRLTDQHEVGLQLISDLHLKALLESGQFEVKGALTMIDRLVQEVVDECRPQLVGREVELRAVVPDLVAPVEMDGGRLKHVLKHLVGHSIRSTREGHVTLHVHVDPMDDRPQRIDVVDSGHGISAEDLAEILLPLEEVSPDDGTRLGLAICRTIADKLDVDMQIETRGARGSTYSLVLEAPLATHRAAGPVTADPDAGLEIALEEDAPDLSSRCVIVAIADPAQRAEVAAVLWPLGCEVNPVAPDDLAAAAALAPPDLVIGELGEAGSAAEAEGGGPVGWGTLTRLRVAPATRDVPWLALDLRRGERRALLGRLDLLPRPLTDAALAATLARHGLADGVGRILLALEDAGAAESVVSNLQRRGYHVRYAATGEAALAILQVERFDAYVVDPLLSLRDGGADLLEALCRVRRYVGTPLLLPVDGADAGPPLQRLALVAETVARPADRFAADLERVVRALLDPAAEAEEDEATDEGGAAEEAPPVPDA